jgi:thymidine phosphorylase
VCSSDLYGVGLDQVISYAAKVDNHTPLALVYARTEEQWQQAAEAVQNCFQISDKLPQIRPVIYQQVAMS